MHLGETSGVEDANRHSDLRYGNFVLLDPKPIGKGGMGEVYRARDLSGRRVALKILRPHSANRSRRLPERFNRESTLLGMLKHRNIVELYESGEHKGEQFFTMEYVDGLDLETYLEQNHVMDPGLAAHVIKGVASALSAVHECGVVHRDVKPQNVMLTPNYGVKLLDFGVAKYDDGMDLTLEDEVCGFKYTLAPEQIHRLLDPDIKVDKRSDLFSLGVVAYVTLTGHELGENHWLAYQTLPKEVRDQLPFHHKPLELRVSKINPAAASYEHIVLKLLAGDPSERYQDAKELINALDSVQVPLKKSA